MLSFKLGGFAGLTSHWLHHYCKNCKPHCWRSVASKKAYRESGRGQSLISSRKVVSYFSRVVHNFSRVPVPTPCMLSEAIDLQQEYMVAWNFMKMLILFSTLPAVCTLHIVYPVLYVQERRDLCGRWLGPACGLLQAGRERDVREDGASLHGPRQVLEAADLQATWQPFHEMPPAFRVI